MRIAHVYKDFYPPVRGGIERYVADIAAATAARGFTVEVHIAGVRRSRSDYVANGVAVHRHREVARLASSPITSELPLAVSRLDVDIVHLHMPNPVAEIGALVNRRAGALVATFHAPVVRQRLLRIAYSPLREHLLRRCATIFVSSKQLSAHPELAGHHEAVHVLPFGVSPSLAPSSETSSEPPREPPAEPSDASDRRSTTRFLFVGRLVSYKGLDVLMAAVARLTDEPVRLTIVGAGPMRAELTDLVAELGVGDRVELVGPVDDATLAELYRSHDVFVMPSVSRAEAFGMAMCEAMASGLAAISTSVGTGTDWVNLDGVTGLVVPPGDPDALSGALATLAGDADLRARLAYGATQRARREFSFDRHVDGLVEVYESLGGS